MGFGGISIWQLLIILAIIILLFGTKKLRNIGTDLGNAVRGFKKAVNSDNESDNQKNNEPSSKNNEQLKVEANNQTVESKNAAKVAPKE